MFVVKKLKMEESILRNNIRLHRLRMGYSQEYMAIQLDISQYAYHKIESGKTALKVTTLLEISEILELDVQRLFDTV